MRFFVESRATTDRGDIVKDDSLVRNVGSGQIEQTGSSSSSRCIKKRIIDIGNDNFSDDYIIEDNKRFDRLVGQLEEDIRDAKRFDQEEKITREKYQEKVDYEEEDVAIDEIRDFWECTSSILSTSSFEYMRILSANPSSH
ncbi:hypothetical protein KPH14_010064 [Odynerus spinipes]|uniref:Uncharacterized protein n=1 Tax=Odynerus spinipes TaxID=1348599 RepID=A0AAD9RT67_9HYME|nr:hypothetical protein KPH14_010064 [Odynerus spinipes]